MNESVKYVQIHNVNERHLSKGTYKIVAYENEIINEN
jgi:hypothetical protein